MILPSTKKSGFMGKICTPSYQDQGSCFASDKTELEAFTEHTASKTQANPSCRSGGTYPVTHPSIRGTSAVRVSGRHRAVSHLDMDGVRGGTLLPSGQRGGYASRFGGARSISLAIAIAIAMEEGCTVAGGWLQGRKGEPMDPSVVVVGDLRRGEEQERETARLG